MLNNKISRRKFLTLSSLTSISVLPCIRALAKITGVADIVQFIDYAYRLTDWKNLFSAEFYFIGVKKIADQPLKGIDRLQACPGRDSFMIVRLPQQHVAETYIVLPTDDLHDCTKALYAQTRIAGYSFLVFRLFFSGNDGHNLDGSLSVTAENLLNWNAPWLRLVVREDQAMSQPLFQNVQDPNPAKRTYPSPIRYNEYPLGYKQIANGGPFKFSPEYFPRSADTDSRISINNPSPITAIEAPYRLILSPELPDHDYLFQWSFSQKPDTSADSDGSELWMATLRAIPDPNKKPQKTSDGSTNKPVEDQPMAVAIIGSPDAPSGADPCLPNPDPDFKDTLPSPMDRRNLVELYFLAQTILRAKSRKIAFTPLGLCGTIEFQNTLYKRIMSARTDLNLYQWKQAISFGRDQEVQVVTLVKEMCFSFMMLHVKVTKRRTQCKVSFLDYTEYLIPLEHEKNYLLYKPTDDNHYVKQNYKFNTPFKSIRFATLTPKQILVVDNLGPADAVRTFIGNAALGDQNNKCRLNEPVIAFWAKQPYPQGNASSQDGYLEWEFVATDWQGQETVIKKKLYLVSSVFNCSNNPTQNFQLPSYSGLQTLTAALATPQAPQKLNDIEDAFSKATAPTKVQDKPVNQEWTQVYQQSEQYLLEKSDLFRQHLQNVFGRIDSAVKAVYAAHSEWVDGQGDVEEAITHFKTTFYQLIQDRFADINTQILAFKEKALLAMQNSSLSQDMQDLAARIYHYSILPGEYLDKYLGGPPGADLFKQAYTNLKAKMDALDPEIDRLLQSLPPKLGLGSLRPAFQEARQVYCFLEHVEDSCKCKVNAYKKSIGISLYKVEQGINDLQQQLQSTVKQDWQKVYKTVEDYYHKANMDISNITTEALIFKNNVRSTADKLGQNAMDFFDYDGTRMQLHSLQGYIGKVNDAVNKEVLLRMTLAKSYLQAQVDNEVFDIKTNTQKAFAQIHAEAKEYLKGAMRQVGQEIGGIINPEMAADLVSYAHDLTAMAKDADTALTDNLQDVKNSVADLKNTFNNELTTLQSDLTAQLQNATQEEKNKVIDLVNQKKAEFENQFNLQKAKIVMIANNVQSQVNNAINQAKDIGNQAADYFKGLEAKILGSLQLKDILNLDTSQLPKLNKTDKSLYYNFITNKFVPSLDLGTINFTTTSATRLVCYFEKPLNNPGAYVSQTRLENFSVGIFSSRIVVDFESLEILSNQQVKSQTNVNIKNVSFRQELAFLDALSKNIKIPGTGIVLNITPQAIIASYTYGFPTISGGAFTLANLKFNVGIKIPLPIGGGKLKPIVASFGINSFEDPFVVAVSIYGGRGHFVLETTPRYINKIDFGMEFGGYLGLNLGIAQGEAYLMAGMRYVFARDAEGQSSMSFFGYLTCGGSITVFGFITITVTFMLCLAYVQTPAGSSLTGTASLTLSVKIGFFEKSFSLTFTKTIAGSDNNNSQTYLERPFNEDHLYYAVNPLPADKEEEEIFWADYDEAAETARRQRIKQRPVFTDASWKLYCQSFAYKKNP